MLQEAIALGQRVEGWTVAAEIDGQWKPIAQGTTIGRKRIARVDPITAKKIRVEITRARACPTLSAIAVFGTVS